MDKDTVCGGDLPCRLPQRPKLHLGCGLWPAAFCQSAWVPGGGKRGSLALEPAASLLPNQTGSLHGQHEHFQVQNANCLVLQSHRACTHCCMSAVAWPLGPGIVHTVFDLLQDQVSAMCITSLPVLKVVLCEGMPHSLDCSAEWKMLPMPTSVPSQARNDQDLTNRN